MSPWLNIIGYLEILILILLVGLSVWSVGIIIDRKRYFQSRLSGRSFEDALRDLEAGKAQAATGLFSELYGKLQNNGAPVADRVAKKFATEEKLRFEKGLTVLATLGANAPFIGLFGTVLGIMAAFAALSGSDAGTGAGSDVMNGIARALIATAAGLFVAIPAVVAFNTYTRKMKEVLQQCDAFKDAWVLKHGGAVGR